MSYRDQLAARLLQAREAAGLSQAAAARGIGVSQAALSHYERGNRGVTVEVLQRLATMYKCGVDTLLPDVKEAS